jgi:hypothetical protein
MSSKDWEEFNKSLKGKYQGGNDPFFGPNFQFKGMGQGSQDWTKTSEAQAKQAEELARTIEKQMKANSKMWENGQMSEKQARELADKIRKEMQTTDWQKSKMTEQQAREMAETARKLAEGSAKMSEAQTKELENRIRQMELSKDQAGMSEKRSKELADMLKKEFGNKDWGKQPFMDAKAAEKWSKEMQQGFSKSSGWANGPKMDFGQLTAGQDFKALAASFTPEQKQKHERQGFLRYSDLTPQQRRYLGHMTNDGDWTVKYSGDGHEFTIKSDRQ